MLPNVPGIDNLPPTDLTSGSTICKRRRISCRQRRDFCKISTKNMKELGIVN